MTKIQAQNETNFDDFTEDYQKYHKANIKISGFEPTYFDEHKIKTIAADYTAIHKKNNLKFLNFGCGIGKSEVFINKYFPDCSICSIDVSEKSIETAKEKNKQFKNIEFIKYENIEDLAFNDKFDIIFVANVFHHIPEKLHIHILNHLRTFLSSEGYLYVFEHNPQNPVTKNAFNTCEIDVGCNMIHPSLFYSMCKEANYKTIQKNYVLFFPKILSMFSGFEKYLKWCPLGAQYYIKAR